MSECTACGLLFGGTTAFDLHRVGTYEPDTRRCLSPEELPERGLILRNGVWRQPPPKNAARSTPSAGLGVSDA